ncbi:MAG: TIGR01841 family phasin [Acetobacteraceae bacterium]|nr:TIGR01841 family phasin [Acetobacteraceae bacterium]MCX7685074.1 TIGR01841 family phasin [Acetobacteraceae bacterium]MDW8399547.1 TIGR01841 family phasin [Acetobacteraceae bacterium]
MAAQPPEFDMMKFFADFRLPPMPDMAALAAAQRKNLEALSAANRIALEGAQAVARRHMEIMQAAMAELTQAMSGLANPPADPKEAAARQIEALKAAYEKAVANLRELAELIQKANAEALALLNKRFAEALEEAKQMAAKG